METQEISEGQQPQPQLFSHSVRITQTAKGARVEVHCSANSTETVMRESIYLYQNVKLQLKSLGEIIAPIETAKNGSKE